MSNKHQLSSYNNYIQSLRAYSVLIVFLYHLNFDIFSRGYLGVDIFFVISGFVITQRIYIDYISYNKILIKDFFIRRLKRIFPVLFFIIILTLILFSIFGPIGYLKSNFLTSFFSIIGLSNIYFLIKEKNYFDTVFDDPLGHTWSLGVEEQFYIFYPFILYFLFKNIKFNIEKRIIFIFFIFFIFLIFLSFFFSKINPELVFYFPIFRFWEFLAGCLTFFIYSNFNINKNGFLSFSCLCLIIIILFLDLPENYTVYLSINFLIVIFSSMLILFYQKNFLNKIFLENKLTIFIGNISYSLYLWHLPIIYFVELYFGNYYKNILSFPISIILSIITYHFIENKFRYYNFKYIFKKNYFNKINLSVFFITFILTIFLLFDGKSKNYIEQLVKDNIHKINYLESKFNFHDRTTFWKTSINGNQIYIHCTSDSFDFRLNDFNLREECLKMSDYEDLFFFIEGNSHTANFVSMFDNSNFINNFYYAHKNIQGDTYHDRSFDNVNSIASKFKKVIYTTNIDNFFQFNSLKDNLVKFSEDVLILILGPVPNITSKLNLPTKCLIRQYNCIINTEEDKKRRKLSQLKKSIKELSLNNNNIFFFDPYEILCPSINCNIYDKEKNILKLIDQSHLSKEGSLILIPSFKIFIEKEFF
jgi:peptidoglycan/LPS O-acetylase OafA/YrhL